MGKISIDCRMIGSSGIGTFIQGILSFLIKRNDISILLIGEKSKLNPYLSNSVELLECSIKPFSIHELFFFPVEEINKTSCLFSPNYNIPTGIKVPIFSTIHDVLFLDFPQIKGFIGRILRREAVKRAVKLSDHIFTVSEFSKSRILYHCPYAKGITICYNGADNIYINNRESDYGIIRDSYFLYIGNIKPHKGLNILLDAYEKVTQSINHKLVIVGNQNSFLTSDKQISKRIYELSSRKDIIFTGYVDQSTLINLITNAYCLIQPSVYEGFGLPPLEAMHLGTPVILSDIPVFKELFSNFPVTFFESENTKSLAKAMLQEYNRIQLTSEQLEKYTYKKTSDIIINTIKERIHECSSIR